MFRNPGFHFGTFLGIPVTINPSWFVMLFFFTYVLTNVAVQAGVPVPLAVPVGLLTALIAFITLLAHEYGHALMGRHYGIGTERITLFMLGGVAHMKSEAKRPMEEFMVAIAGPAVSIFCMIFFGIGAVVMHVTGAPFILYFPFETLAYINFVFAAFNMIPGFPMDGGRVLRAILWGATGNYLKATRLASFGGQFFSWLLIGLGLMFLFSGNLQGIFPIIMGVFLNWLARTSYRQAQWKSAFDRVRVADLMRPIQVVVPAELPVSRVVSDYIYRVHADRFPVVRGPSLLGYISADDISLIDRKDWDWTPAEKLVRPFRRSEILSPDQQAFNAFQKVNMTGRPSLPVFNGKQLIGYLFAQDVMNYLTKMGAK
ncbi:MAG: site-2 protease family protein [Candidatus Sumerlaeia bacterium]|nr:site-2 protease family protein [Candidatus Sumerlaeia bacterium]